jgi:hypothetical protein
MEVVEGFATRPGKILLVIAGTATGIWVCYALGWYSVPLGVLIGLGLGGLWIRKSRADYQAELVARDEAWRASQAERAEKTTASEAQE